MIYNLRRQREDGRDFMLKDALAPTARQVKLPERVDLREKFPEAYNQLELGSCSANAGCANLVYLLKIPGLVLSRLYMYYKERELEGTIFEDSGATMRDICKVAVKGVCEEKHFPYETKAFTCPPSYNALVDAPNHRATSFHSARSLGGIKAALGLENKPVLIGMMIYSSFESEEVARTGLVPIPKEGEEEFGGHAVLVVGYDDIKQCLIVRNSWGPEWGDKGYFYLPYEFVNKGLAFDFWVLG